MSESPRRRLLDFIGGSPSFVAEGCRITGDVETVGPLVMCGTVRGDGHVRGALSLTAKAEWEGEVRAERGVIAGKVTGILTVEDKLEIGATAVVRARERPRDRHREGRRHRRGAHRDERSADRELRRETHSRDRAP